MYLADIRTQPLRRIDDRTSEVTLYDDGDVEVGVWECTQGCGPEPGGDFVETMFMVSGRATVHPDDAGAENLDLAPGTLWATPQQWGSRWCVHQTVRKLYVVDRRQAAAARVSHLPNAYTVKLAEATPRPVVIDGDPREVVHQTWTSGASECGVWECTAGVFPFARVGYHEVFCVLAGHATLSTDDGMSFDLRPGSVLLTPAGVTGRWHVHERLRKVYTIVTL